MVRQQPFSRGSISAERKPLGRQALRGREASVEVYAVTAAQLSAPELDGRRWKS